MSVDVLRDMAFFDWPQTTSPPSPAFSLYKKNCMTTKILSIHRLPEDVQKQDSPTLSAPLSHTHSHTQLRMSNLHPPSFPLPHLSTSAWTPTQTITYVLQWDSLLMSNKTTLPPPPHACHWFTEVMLGEHLSPSTTSSTPLQAPVSLWSPLSSTLAFVSSLSTPTRIHTPSHTHLHTQAA